jgi:class 3 adenylate cyclase
MATHAQAIGRPARDEAAAYYHGYIERVAGDDILGVLQSQRDATLAFLRVVSEQRSLQRYAPGKWSMRELLGHVNDTERVFVYRALWFARGFDAALPSFDQDPCVAAAGSDAVSWAAHVEEFAAIRSATLSFFRNLPPEAWLRRGVASGNPFSVRALAYVAAGHVAHHVAVLQERYA